MAGKEEFYELYTTYTEHTLWEIETLSSEKQTVLLGCYIVYLVPGYDYICKLAWPQVDMSIEHNRLDVDCRHQKIKQTKSRHILGKQNFQTLHPFQKDTADKISNIMRRPQKIYM